MRLAANILYLTLLLTGGYAVQANDYWQQYPDRPRLIISTEELPQWHQKLELPELQGQLPGLRATCDGYIDPQSDSYVDFREREDDERWRTRKTVYLVSETLYNLALAYLLTGDEKYGEFARDFARDEMITVCEENLGEQLGGVVFGQPYQGWFASFDYASVLRSMAYCFDAVHDLMTAQQRQLVAEHIKQRYIDHTFGPGSEGWRSGAATNQSLHRYWGAAIGMLSIYGEIEQPELQERLEECVKGCEAYFDLQVGRDGGTFEGPGYGGVAGWVCELAAILRRAGYEYDLAGNKRLRNIPKYYLQSILPGGAHISPSGQCFDAMSGPLLLAMCGLHQDRLARFALDLWGGGGTARAADTLVELLMWYDPDLKGASPTELGMSNDMVFRDLGTLVVRSGWDADDYRFSLMAGSGFCGGCPDKGNFTLHALGEAFAVDIGYGALPTARHNSVLIDGQGVVTGSFERTNRAALTHYDIEDAIAAYGRLDLTSSYQGCSQASRQACFIRESEGHPWYLVIADDLRIPEGEHTFDWIFIGGNGYSISVEDDQTFRVIGKQKSLGVHVASPGQVTFEQDIIEHRYMQEVAKTPTRDPGDFPRMRVKATGTECRFVVVLFPWDSPPLDIEGFEDNEFFGAIVKWPDETQSIKFRLETVEGQAMWEVKSALP